MENKRGTTGLIAEERRIKILEILDKRRTVTVRELGKIFRVSEDTIRLDLSVLEDQKLLRRIYGGATRIKRGAVEIPSPLREVTNPEVKAAIGREAAKLVEDGESLIFDASTTALSVARAIDPAKRITVLTSSLDICISLAANTNINLIGTGGTLHSSSFSFVGPQAEDAIHNYFADRLFVGAKSVSIRGNAFADAFELEAHLKRVMLTSAREVNLVLESSKFGDFAFFKVAELTRVRRIITDADISTTSLQSLSDMGIEVVVVETKKPEGRRTS